eukprot:GILI01029616.1.p1 GENE.GILI01029616.1~~GILI01029616.1.p1  ORF type:complete len:428 (+),score=44.77 GILI01029616.1:88-1371(+)
MWRVLKSPAALSLVVLVIQNSALVLMTRISKKQSSPIATTLMNETTNTTSRAIEPYFTSTLVLNQEIVKLLLCLVMFMREWKTIRDKRVYGSATSPLVDNQPPGPLSRGFTQGTHITNIPTTSPSDASLAVECGSSFWHELQIQVCHWETIKLLVPAALFTMQNYLLFVALTYLDAMTFQMLSQSKLISAAIFSVMLLDKKLSTMQWVSLGLLTFGVYLSQGHSSVAAAAGGSNSNKFTSSTTITVGPPSEGQHETMFTSGAVLLGAIACILSGISSSFAGVYFEKVVKTTPPSLAVRNIHLSLFAIPLAILSMIVIDVVPPLLDNNRPPFRYWQGYNSLTYALVLVHALGGLLVAVVVKYADNILKGFATAVAIVVSGLYMTVFWSFVPSTWFVYGCSLVCAATILYQYSEPAKGATTQRKVSRGT